MRPVSPFFNHFYITLFLGLLRSKEWNEGLQGELQAN
jgi:hypothetical protein